MEEMSFQPGKRRLFISVANRDKRSAVMMAKEMTAMGFRILATAGTAEALHKSGDEVKTVKKLREGRPNVLDLIKNGEVDLIVNTPRGKGPRGDGFISAQPPPAMEYPASPICTPLRCWWRP